MENTNSKKFKNNRIAYLALLILMLFIFATISIFMILFPLTGLLPIALLLIFKYEGAVLFISFIFGLFFSIGASYFLFWLLITPLEKSFSMIKSIHNKKTEIVKFAHIREKLTGKTIKKTSLIFIAISMVAFIGMIVVVFLSF